MVTYDACSVYAIEIIETGKFVYIGSCAKPLFARWGQHLCDAYYKNSSDIQKLLHEKYEEEPFPFKPTRLRGPFRCAGKRELSVIEQTYIKWKPRCRLCNMRSANRDAVHLKGQRTLDSFKYYAAKWRAFCRGA